MEVLVITAGLFEGACFPLTGEQTSIGRLVSNDVRLPDNAVSRRHALILRADGNHRILDLGSLNGTYINGERAQGPTVLSHGDAIGIGEARLEYRTALDPPGDAVVEATQRDMGDPLGRIRSQMEALLRFQTQVAHVRAWEPVVGLLCQTVARVTTATVQAAQEEQGEFFPYVPDVFDTIHPLPELDLIREALRTGLPVPVAHDSVFVPLRHRTVPIRGLLLVKAEYADEDLQFATQAIEVALRTPAFGAGGELGATLVLRDPIRERIIGRSAAIEQVITEIRRAASTSVPVLILGETGTGKELAARAIHERGDRSGRPFVAFNCAAFSADLVDSQVFGHEKGAFTGAAHRHPGLFEEARDGTVFLDEVGELPLEVQAKLLRILDTGEYRRLGASGHLQTRARILCATNQDLESRVETRGFRTDLYYRIAGHIIHLPPLRERPGDIPVLADHFLFAHARGVGCPVPVLTDAARRRLVAHRWPGNVRELDMLIQRLVQGGRGRPIDERDLPEFTPPQGPGDQVPLKDLEREHILSVLVACGGNKLRAAKTLGISRQTLYKKLQSYGR